MPLPQGNLLVIALSVAGIIFILLGLVALALPAAQEGVKIWQLNGHHAVYLMDAAGGFAIALGVILTWLGSRLWQQQVES